MTEVKQKLDAEEEIRRQREADKQEENEERRNAFYGSDEKKGGLRRRPKIFCFCADDLDNEEIISMVEITPTFKRSKEVLNEIKTKALGNVAIVPESATTETGGVINF